VSQVSFLFCSLGILTLCCEGAKHRRDTWTLAPPEQKRGDPRPESNQLGVRLLQAAGARRRLPE